MPRLFGFLFLVGVGCGLLDGNVDGDYEREELSSEEKEGLDENQVTILTSLGAITIELNSDEAPITTANFLRYVDDGFFDGDDGLGVTTFHRIIANFMIQGGGYNLAGYKKTTHGAITNEASNGLSNMRGTVAMARLSDPDSATSQFFINHADNTNLDYVDSSNPGYTVFAEVIEGMDVVDAIATVETDGEGAPLEAVVIDDVVRWED